MGFISYAGVLGDKEVWRLVYYFVGLIIIGFLLLQVWFNLGHVARSNYDKLTSYECGFDALSSSRQSFSMRFFMVALLFMIFDVEVVLLIPYIFRLGEVRVLLSFGSHFLCWVFLVLVLVGLLHEFKEGSLEWSLS